MTPFLVLVLQTIKLSILCLYLRIFSAKRRFRLVTYGFIAFTLAQTVTFFLLQLLQCIPLHAIWRLQRAGARCVDSYLLQFLSAVFNAGTDLAILCLPIPILWRLHLPIRKKIGLVLIFTSGGM